MCAVLLEWGLPSFRCLLISWTRFFQACISAELDASAESEAIILALKKLSNTSEKSEEKVQENVHNGIEQLAEKHVVEHEHSEQKPALEIENDEVVEDQKYS